MHQLVRSLSIHSTFYRGLDSIQFIFFFPLKTDMTGWKNHLILIRRYIDSNGLVFHSHVSFPFVVKHAEGVDISSSFG